MMGQARVVARGLLVLFGIPLGAAAMVPEGGVAGQATPATPGLVAPGAEDCAFPPRPIEELLTIVHATFAGTGAPVASPTLETVAIEREADGATLRSISIAGVPWIVDGAPVSSPPAPVAGTPADDAILQAISDVARLQVACANAGDTHRMFSLLTEAAFAGIVEDSRGYSAPMSEDIWRAILSAPPMPIPEGQRRLAPSVLEVRLFPDGRAAAVIAPGPTIAELDGRQPDDLPAPLPSIILFARVGGRWLVDELAGQLKFYLLPSAPSTPSP